MPTAKRLTAAERAAHPTTHLPYRSWCDECVACRRDSPLHHALDYSKDHVPEVMMDYCFVRRDDEAEVVTILVIKKHQSRALEA